jgi:hypothetical protein
MAKLPDLFVNAVTTFDGKALAKGQKQIGGFEKSVKSLAKVFGVAFSVTAIAAFGKASVKAFAEDEAAAVRLSKAVENLGLGFEDARIKNFISELERSANVADDVLRPAFQNLISQTGSVTKSQELLTLALDISAGTGIDAAEVAKDLGLAYLGQTKGLAKYNTGLTKTELSTVGFTKIQTKLNAQFAGQNAARLDTYAGKVAALTIAFGNAQETIGEGLVDSFAILAGDNGIVAATNAMDDFSESIKYALIGLADLVTFEAPAGTVSLFTLLLAPIKDSLMAGPLGALIRLGEKASIKPKPFTTPMTVSGSTDLQTQADKARAKAEADAAKRQKELLALQKKAALAEKNKLSLSKAAAVFDTQRISLAAALRATYDKETILRLEALQAIEEDNGELALKKINELAALQKNADMAKLAGIKEISDATLNAINTQLLTELKAINDSKMAEADKEVARQIAFGKYNAAITAAGELAAKESYSERVQIQLTEIAKLASLSKTSNAALTLNKLRESEELSMIERVAAAQKRADDARLKALQEYAAALGRIGTGGGAVGGVTGTTPGAPSVPSGAPATIADVKAKEAADAIEYFGKKITDVFQTVEDSGAFNALVNSYAGGAINSFNAGTFRANEGASYGTLSRGGAFDRDIVVNVSAGVISQPDEFASLLQETIQKLNRGGDPLTVAGIL